MNARAQLSTLEASGLIQIAALQPELEYLFRHALVQEAAYATLLKQDRRSLHRAAAETIVALHADRRAELAGVIGLHFELAGDTARAAEYLLIAGDHALERFANKEAIAFFTRALALSDDSHVELRLRAAIGGAKAGWSYNQPGADIDRLERTIAGAEGTDQHLVAEAYFWIAYLRRQRGETPESSSGLRTALARMEQIGQALSDPQTAALPRALMGAFDAFTGQIRKGASEMQSALDVLGTAGDFVSRAMLSNFLVLAYARLGDFAAAERTFANANALAGSADVISRLDVDIAKAAIDVERGDIDDAARESLACASRAEDLGAYACAVAATVMYGAASVALDNSSAAKQPLERGRELSAVTNMAPMRTLIHGYLGNARAELGDLPGGVVEWDAALTNARTMGDRYGEAHTLWARARASARQAHPDWKAALADTDRAIELFSLMEANPSLARALHDRARALRALNRPDEAEVAEQRSSELGRQLGLRDAPFRQAASTG